MFNDKDNNNMNNIINECAATLSCVNTDDLRSFDYDTLKSMKDNMNYFMQVLNTVCAAKRAEKDQKEETEKYIAEREAMMAARGNVEAMVSSFDSLNEKEKSEIISLGKLYHHARRSNNFSGMEKMNNIIMEKLFDHNIGSLFVLAHVINLAK